MPVKSEQELRQHPVNISIVGRASADDPWANTAGDTVTLPEIDERTSLGDSVPCECPHSEENGDVRSEFSFDEPDLDGWLCGRPATLFVQWRCDRGHHHTNSICDPCAAECASDDVRIIPMGGIH